MRSATKKKTGRDYAYLRWIKTLPCSVPGCNAIFIEAHHAGQRGLMQKADDRTAIPLCMAHHLHGPQAAHVLGKRFWAVHEIDREQLIRELNAAFDAAHASEEVGVLSPLEVIGVL